MSGNGSEYPSDLGRGTLTRARPTFLTRTATDDASRLFRRTSFPGSPRSDPGKDAHVKAQDPARPAEQTPKEPSGHDFARDVSSHANDGPGTFDAEEVSPGQKRPRKSPSGMAGDSLTAQMYQSSKATPAHEKSSASKPRTSLRPVGGTEKLGTFSGVFVPTSLNVLSVLMFIRFGFILGQGGVLGMMAMLIMAYTINLVTTMSISAVASNGTVRGGGAYYLISRSLGPEFGGSIGVVFYMGFVFNTGMNAVGLVDCLNSNFGSDSGNWSNFLQEGYWWQYLWATVVLVICTGICLAGSSIFARASNGLLVVLMVATLSIPLSALVLQPFQNVKLHTTFTGLSLSTFRENLLPRFSRHAAGSQLRGRENFQDLFGILFPATGGIFAGASMSGDLKNPSKSIPRGTLYGLGLTFITYSLVILALAASVTRMTLYNNVNVIQDTAISGVLILLGEVATTVFSVLMGVIGPAKLLQAIARDSVLPGLSLFGRGTVGSDDPVYAIIFTYIVAQATMLFDINRIASFITMTYLMTFFVTNLACFLLRISSAPNFRPSFHYFNEWTAAVGAVSSVIAMFFVDGWYATGSIGVLVIIFLLIHYTTPPKAWGDVSQSLIYHQVRKYLLRLRQHEHVKFWRPQILLFVNDPRRSYKLIQFCNSLKKGALFVLGHVIVTTNFGASVPEARKQQAAWKQYIDFTKIKAFINVAISPSIEWGARNVVLSAGLGGMRPNIVVMGFYNLQQFRQEQPLVDVPSPPPEKKQANEEGSPALRKRRRGKGTGKSAHQLDGALPTDVCYVETRTDVQSYLMVLEDMILKLQINVAIATGFGELELPEPKGGNSKKYVDLWPIQMSAQIPSADGEDVLTTNFDTYTLIMQLGCILHTVPSWKHYALRVAVFVEYESDVEEERLKVAELLDNLRIEAEIFVFWLASGDLKTYQAIVNGDDQDAYIVSQVDKVLEDEGWWTTIQKLRGQSKTGDTSAYDEISEMDGVNGWQDTSLASGRDVSVARYDNRLRSLINRSRRRQSFSNLSSLGVSLGMRTQRLQDDLISRHASHASASEDSSDSTESGFDNEVEEEVESEESELAMSETDDDATEEAEQPPQSARSSTRKTHSKKSSLSSKKSGSSKKRRGRSGVPRDAPEISAMDMAASPGLLAVEAQPTSRSSSRGAFTSSPVPRTKVNEDEAGPSIMFADEPKPLRKRLIDADVDARRRQSDSRSIYKRNIDSKSPPGANGFPSAASIPLSFNDLPSRAQYLILNELMTQQSDDTAVIFTTLPAPLEGTYKSESDSLGYVSDLEVLTGGLPPSLMIHSNSMTVTMNL